MTDPAAATIVLLEGVATSPEVNGLRSRVRRELADLIRDMWAEYDPVAAAAPQARAVSVGLLGIVTESMVHLIETGRLAEAPEHVPALVVALERVFAPPRVKLGIVTPALTLLPRAHAQWEETADVATIVGIVREAERLGYHHCTCSEHVAVPVDVAEVRGGRYWDPLATFGYLAAVTERIKLATHVLVLATTTRSRSRSATGRSMSCRTVA